MIRLPFSCILWVLSISKSWLQKRKPVSSKLCVLTLSVIDDFSLREFVTMKSLIKLKKVNHKPLSLNFRNFIWYMPSSPKCLSKLLSNISLSDLLKFSKQTFNNSLMLCTHVGYIVSDRHSERILLDKRTLPPHTCYEKLRYCSQPLNGTYRLQCALQ